MAIEEPELYQHPVQAQAFAEVLRVLAEDRSQSIQVAYATHSPYFIAPAKFHQVRRMTRLGDAHQANAPRVLVKQTSIESVVTKLNGVVEESVVRKQLDSVALHRLPEALFASTVVLVEGTTDRAVMEGLTSRPGQRPLVTDGVVIADTGGKSSMSLPRAILEELGIPTFIMFDADGGCEARMRLNNRSEKVIESTMADHAERNRSLLSQVGEPETDWPSTEIGPSHAVLEDTLESFLHNEWPEWTAAVESIRQSGMGDPSKNGLLYRDATRKAAGEPPQHLMDLLSSIRTLK
jgi:predicted ATP-dependent endonuclease of OLD family